MLIKIYRDPNSVEGGAAPADAGAASGGSPFESFSQELATLTQEASDTPQPAEGNKTDGPASPTEGGDGGGQEGGQGTTAPQDGDSPSGEEKKGAEEAWSQEELNALKEHGWDKIPFSAETRAILKSNRELRSQFDRVSGSNSNAVSEVEAYRAALYANDFKKLQEISGVDLKIDQRTPDTMIQELQTRHGQVRGHFEKAISQLQGAGNTEAAQALLDVGNQILGQIDAEAKVLYEEKKWQERESKLLQKAGKAPDPKNAYKDLSGKAKTNLASLTAEDPEAPKYFKYLEADTKPGGALRAMGIDLARAFGQSPESAKRMIEYGKGLYLLKEMPQILAKEQKKWESEYSKKKSMAGPGGSSSRPGNQQVGDPIAALSAEMSYMAGSGR